MTMLGTWAVISGQRVRRNASMLMLAVMENTTAPTSNRNARYPAVEIQGRPPSRA